MSKKINIYETVDNVMRECPYDSDDTVVGLGRKDKDGFIDCYELFYENETDDDDYDEIFEKRIDDALNDNGLIGFEYMYGLIGVLWFIYLIIQMGIDSLKMYFRKNNYSILGYLIFCLAIVTNIMHLYWFTGALYNGMILGILENISKDKNG